MGLRYSRDAVSVLLRGFANMEESTTYQEIIEKGLEKGRLEEARGLLLRQARKRLGAPTREAEADLNAIYDIQRLEDLVDRLLDGTAKTWDDLLTP